MAERRELATVTVVCCGLMAVAVADCSAPMRNTGAASRRGSEVGSAQPVAVAHSAVVTMNSGPSRRRGAGLMQEPPLENHDGSLQRLE